MADEKPPRGQDPNADPGWSEPVPPAAGAGPEEVPAAPASPSAQPEIDIPAPLDFGTLDGERAQPPSSSLTAALFPGEPPPAAPPAAVAAAPTPARPAATSPEPARPRRFLDIVGENVRIGGSGVPLWIVLGALGTLIAVGCGVLGLSLGLGLSSAGQYADSIPTPDSSSAHAASSAPAPVASSAVPHTLPERVEAGEPGALAELEMNAGKALKADQAVLLARGKAAAVARQARELRARVDADPTLIEKPEVVAHLREYSASELTSVEALAAMARLPGPISADLLYEVWTSTSERNPTTELAEHLVYSDDVLPKASPALKVALDLRRASDSDVCADTLAAVKRAADEGDRRDLAVLAKLTRKFGCGSKKKDDCYPCLRDGEDLKRAISESRKRPIPKH